MFGKLGDIAGLVKKAKDMQKNLKKAQKEIAGLEFAASSGNGLVEVTVSGDLQVKKVTISPKCFAEADAETVQDLLVVALNSAMANAKNESKERLSAITGGLGIDIPGLM